MLDNRLTRRDFLKITGLWALRTGVVGAGGLGYSRALEPAWIDIASVKLTLPRLAEEFHGYRIVQVSDIHMHDWMNREKLAHVVGLVNEQKADLVALTGDFVSWINDEVVGGLEAGLGALQARDGAVAVLGNHDHWNGPEIVRGILDKTGVRNVSNSFYTLRRGKAEFHIAGVDDVWERQDDLPDVMRNLPTTGAAMLLAHEPDFADTSAATGRFDLQISGHSHGGQVIVPFVGPLRLPYLGQKYWQGLYKVGDMLQYTNRGVGMIHPQVRFNCRPEITAFTLQAGSLSNG